MSTIKKICLIIGVVVAFIGVELVYFKATARTTHALLGTPVPVLSRKHVPDGTKINYNSNPPSSGAHYDKPQDAGIYTKAPADGHLVHSLEHGAIILWYNPNKVTNEQITELQKIFRSMPEQKKIMTPRANLLVPVALSSWGRVLKLQTIDAKAIKAFFTTNYDEGPEQADI